MKQGQRLTDDFEVHPLQRVPVELVLGGLADEAPESALPDDRLVALPRHEAHDVVAHRFLRLGRDTLGYLTHITPGCKIRVMSAGYNRLQMACSRRRMECCSSHEMAC